MKQKLVCGLKQNAKLLDRTPTVVLRIESCVYFVKPVAQRKQSLNYFIVKSSSNKLAN